MACHLFGAKPLSKPELDYCQLDHQEYISIQWNFNQNIKHFLFTEMHLKTSSVKRRPFCPVGDEFMCWLPLPERAMVPVALFASLYMGGGYGVGYDLSIVASRFNRLTGADDELVVATQPIIGSDDQSTATWNQSAVKPLIKGTHLSRQQNCLSLRCSWSIACRRCSNYIFILDLTPGFNGLDKDNSRQDETHLSLGIWCTLY